MDFAEKLADLRSMAGCSQEALAEKICVSRQAVSKWETGTTLPETHRHHAEWQGGCERKRRIGYINRARKLEKFHRM